ADVDQGERLEPVRLVAQRHRDAPIAKGAPERGEVPGETLTPDPSPNPREAHPPGEGRHLAFFPVHCAPGRPAVAPPSPRRRRSHYRNATHQVRITANRFRITTDQFGDTRNRSRAAAERICDITLWCCDTNNRCANASNRCADTTNR